MAKPLNRPFKGLKLKKREVDEAAAEPDAPKTFADAATADGVKRVAESAARVSPAKTAPRRAPDKEPERDHAFSVRVDAELVEGRRDDTEPVVIPWLLRQEPSAKLDLHRLAAHEARRKVQRFVRSRAKKGDEVVVIVTGRGRGSKGVAILKRECPEWLVEKSMHTFVRAFATAPPEHGGEGALLVLLA